MPTQAKEYTELELDQIRADAAEQARKAAAARCLEICAFNVCDSGPYIYEGAVEEIAKEFGL